VRKGSDTVIRAREKAEFDKLGKRHGRRSRGKKQEPPKLPVHRSNSLATAPKKDMLDQIASSSGRGLDGDDKRRVEKGRKGE